MNCHIQNREQIVENYLVGALSEKAMQDFEEHYFNCNLCFQEVKLRKELAGLIKDEGQILFKDLLEEKTRSVGATNPVSTFKFWPKRAAIGWAYAVCFVLLIVVGGVGIRYYNTSYKIDRAANLLKENYRIFFESTPRLSGNYASKGILMLMDPEEDPTYLVEAQELVDQAVQDGAKSAKAKLIQAQIYYINEEPSKADSVLNQLNTEEKKSAAVLNDLGVFSFTRQDWQQALEYFEAANEEDPSFAEAYYNAALSLTKLGSKDRARAKFRTFIELETDEGWINAARQHMRSLGG